MFFMRAFTQKKKKNLVKDKTLQITIIELNKLTAGKNTYYCVREKKKRRKSIPFRYIMDKKKKKNAKTHAVLVSGKL